MRGQLRHQVMSFSIAMLPPHEAQCHSAVVLRGVRPGCVVLRRAVSPCRRHMTPTTFAHEHAPSTSASLQDTIKIKNLGTMSVRVLRSICALRALCLLVYRFV